MYDPQKQLEAAVANGRNLRELRFHTTWVSSCSGIEQIKIPFELENARNLMLRDSSRIRVIGVGRALYTVRPQLAGLIVPSVDHRARVNGCRALLKEGLCLKSFATSCMTPEVHVVFLVCFVHMLPCPQLGSFMTTDVCGDNHCIVDLCGRYVGLYYSMYSSAKQETRMMTMSDV